MMSRYRFATSVVAAVILSHDVSLKPVNGLLTNHCNEPGVTWFDSYDDPYYPYSEMQDGDFTTYFDNDSSY